MFITYAHRGASEYAPENTMSSFYLGFLQGANGVETDVRRTKDGVLVLFHDTTLERVMHESGSISDYTYSELLQMRVYNDESGKEDIIVTLEDFLKYFSHKNVTFAIELKDAGIEQDVIDLLEKYSMREKTYITSNWIEYLANVKRIDSRYRIGHLLRVCGESEMAAMRAIGGEQLCPKADIVTAENVAYWKSQGFEVRAWGVKNVEQMKQMYDFGTDGMTINYPDLAIEYIASCN